MPTDVLYSLLPQQEVQLGSKWITLSKVVKDRRDLSSQTQSAQSVKMTLQAYFLSL